MARTRIQLFAINQRTLAQWHNERTKAMMRETIAMAVPGPSAAQATAEPLAAPRALLPEPEQPDRPLQHLLPEDASGLAATIRGPLAPELYSLVSARVPPAIASSSTSSSGSVAPAAAAASAAAPASAPAAARTPGAVPKTTAWSRRLQEEKERRAREEGRLVKPARRLLTYKCRSCGHPKTREFGHSRYGGAHFCSRADPAGRTPEQWLEEKQRSGTRDPRDPQDPCPPN
ncbi:hypothetical protein ACEWY4_022282 [Coilia grayii]|uniref:Uncharacterized protein n=1 Tax=Coilia grayii TaxID=363190 RepID=A0ABD1J6L8_9TELE